MEQSEAGFTPLDGDPGQPIEILAAHQHGTVPREPVEQEEKTYRLRPLDDRIIVRPIEEEEQRAGGLIVPDMAKEKPQVGEVVAVGPGAYQVVPTGPRAGLTSHLAQLAVKVGDRIMYSRFAGSEIRLGREEFLVLRCPADVLAVLEEVPNGE